MKTKILRNISLIFVTLLAAWIGLRHQYPEISLGLGSGPLDKYCPFGGIETALTYVSTGGYLQKTGFSNFILLAATLILVALTGSSFCGWLCPLGAVQDWLSKLGKKVFGHSFTFTGKTHELLKYLKFVVLGLIIFFTYSLGELVFAEFDPYKAFFHFRFETYTAVVVLIVFIVLSLLSERFWCKYLCPFGAIFSIIAPISIFKIHRNSSSCINCGKCTSVCPMSIDVENVQTVPESQCIKCMDCVDACPIKDTLNLTFGKPEDTKGDVTYEG